MARVILRISSSIALAFCVLFAAPATAAGWQCATFARGFSGIDLHGDAASWWGQATGHYVQGSVPKVGSVMVFKPTAAMRVGHVATVSEVVSQREIRVTHANWSPVAGRRGQIESDVTVVDTSGSGDWTQVRVWYGPAGDLGRHNYPIYGFIYAHPSAAPATATAVAAIDALPVELAGL